MFESVVPPPGADGLIRASRIAYALSAFAVLSFAVRLTMHLTERWPSELPYLIWNGSFALIAFLTARGIDAQRIWARRVGYGLAVAALVNVPVGTVIGAALFVYLRRASRAGLFA